MTLLALTISFLITFFTLPIVIRLFKAINFIDAPETRKIHKINTPSLGGIAIYSSVLLTMAFIIPLSELATYKFFVAGIVMAFILGVRDDIASLFAGQKLIVQTMAAFLAVYYADIRLDGFYGIFGFGEVHPYASILFSIFLIVAMTNAFNLIDGIDGLAGSIGLLSALCFGLWFLKLGMIFYTILCFSMVGALAAFLFFNWQPSRIFMGDTGSLVTGFILSCTAIEFIKSSSTIDLQGFWDFDSFVAIAIALLIIPIYDTLRVFSIRILSGKSPFVPDKRHLHHVLLKQGFNHGQSSLMLLLFTIGMVALAIGFDQLGNSFLITIQVISVILLGLFFDLRLIRINNEHRKNYEEHEEMYVSKSA